MVLKLSRMSFDNLFQRFTALKWNDRLPGFVFHGGSVTAWWCILMNSVLYSPARDTYVLYIGPGVPIPAKSNSWVVVWLHGVGFWQIQEGSEPKWLELK